MEVAMVEEIVSEVVEEAVIMAGEIVIEVLINCFCMYVIYLLIYFVCCDYIYLNFRWWW